MPSVRIVEEGCRGCTLCVDVCAVDVFEYDEVAKLAVVVHSEDCFGCLSCTYACPSRCVVVNDMEPLRPFHRIPSHVALVQKFLQADAGFKELSDADWQEAEADVSARLTALTDTVVDTIGRGYHAVGRRAGTIAAAHMPEMYDQSGLEDVLAAMKHRFAKAFEFDFQVEGDRATLDFHPCGLCAVVRGQGQQPGDAVLCQLFHEYWVGLFTAFVGTTFKCEVPQAGDTCRMEMFPAG